MKKYKAKTGKLTVTLGCIAALSAAGLGGCGMADAGNKAESERQVTVAETQGVYDPETEIQGTNVPEAMVMVDIGPILNNNSITIGDMSLSLSESKRDIIAKLETAGLNYSEHQPDSPDEVKYDSYYNVAEGCIQIYFLNDSCVRIRLINYESSPSLRVQTAQELRTLNTCNQMIELYGDDFETHTYSYKGIYTIYRYSIGDFIYEFGIPGEDAEKIYNIDIYFPSQSPIYKYGEEIPETT